jgi:ABC-2 type transport system ATP-binding protein
MEEAEKCDRLAILSKGQLVALGSPEELKSQIGGEVVTLQTAEVDRVAAILSDRLGLAPKKLSNLVRIEERASPDLFGRLHETVGEWTQSITVGKPTLEDVFIHHTGHQFWEEEDGKPS